MNIEVNRNICLIAKLSILMSLNALCEALWAVSHQLSGVMKPPAYTHSSLKKFKDTLKLEKLMVSIDENL